MKTSHLFQTGVPLGLTSSGKVVMIDASNSGWGALYEARLELGSWFSLKQCLHINCLEMMVIFLVLKPSCQPYWTPLTGLLRQHVGGSFYKSPRWSEVTLPIQDGKTPPPVGTVQSTLTEGSSCARQTEPRSEHTVLGQCICSRKENTPPNGSNDLVCIQESRGRPL